MKTHFLFPHSYRKIGWLLFLPALFLSVVLTLSGQSITDWLEIPVFAIADDNLFTEEVYFNISRNPIADELLVIALLVGAVLIGFSKLKNEDEYIEHLRYESLVWATYFNIGVMLFATVFVYGIYYFNVLLANIITLLLFFIVRFQFKLATLRKNLNDDE